MILNNNTLQLDIKLTDQQRQNMSNLLTADPTLSPTCVIVGDSDIDYSLSPNVSTSAILNAPYAPSGVKWKLIYNGVGKNLSGEITTFARKILADGTIQSLYTYPTDLVFSNGATAPSLVEGYDWNQITFDDLQSGYILFFQTVLDYYFDADGNKERFLESYNFTIDWSGSSITPANWDYVIDNTNGSILLAKQDTTSTPIGFNYRGTITITGQFSQISKIVTFNF